MVSVFKCDSLSPGKRFQMCLVLPPAFAYLLSSHGRTIPHFFFPEQRGVHKIKRCLEIQNSIVSYQLSVGTLGLSDKNRIVCVCIVQ